MSLRAHAATPSYEEDEEKLFTLTADQCKKIKKSMAELAKAHEDPQKAFSEVLRAAPDTQRKVTISFDLPHRQTVIDHIRTLLETRIAEAQQEYEVAKKRSGIQTDTAREAVIEKYKSSQRSLDEGKVAFPILLSSVYGGGLAAMMKQDDTATIKDVRDGFWYTVDTTTGDLYVYAVALLYDLPLINNGAPFSRTLLSDTPIFIVDHSILIPNRWQKFLNQTIRAEYSPEINLKIFSTQSAYTSDTATGFDALKAFLRCP